jgi:hypothetical protein
MKKIVFVIMVLGVVLFVAGCAGGTSGATTSSSGDTTTVTDQTSTSDNGSVTSDTSETGDTTASSDDGSTVSSDESATDTTVAGDESTDTTEGDDTSTTEAEDTTTTTEAQAEESSPGTHQQTDSLLSFSGTWKSTSSSSADGGSFAYADSSGASVTIRFIGTSLSWIAKKSPAYGQAKVTVDGGTAKTVDLYSSSTSWKKTVFTTGTLKKAAHTVVISWTGKKSSKATGTNIDVDAIKVTGTITGRYQQGSSKISYSGTWKTVSSSSASGGGFKYADSKGASVTIKFSGTDLALIAKTGPSYGKAKITVDGSKTTTVNFYSKSVSWQKRVWSTGILDDGEHTVKIEWLGTKGSGSTGTYIDIDAFDVAGSLK